MYLWYLSINTGARLKITHKKNKNLIFCRPRRLLSFCRLQAVAILPTTQPLVLQVLARKLRTTTAAVGVEGFGKLIWRLCSGLRERFGSSNRFKVRCNLNEVKPLPFSTLLVCDAFSLHYDVIVRKRKNLSLWLPLCFRSRTWVRV